MSYRGKLIWTGKICLLVALSSTGINKAYAAQTAEDDVENASDAGDIVVTARKRDESITKVPDAITAFTAQKIEEAGIETVRDFTNLTPNITIAGFGRSFPLIMVRGLAQATNGEAPVAIVVDGVQISHPAFINQDYGDIQQVEVLRGPQGSLYGRNAIGGAITITTKEPTNDFEGRVRASYGKADTVKANIDLSGPIVPEKVLFRIGGSYERTDGQIRNLFNGRLTDAGHGWFLHSRVLFNLSDTLTLDLRANGGRSRDDTPGTEVVSRADWNDFNPGFVNVNTDPPIYEKRKIYDFSGKLEYSGNGFDVRSVTGYAYSHSYFLGDVDFTPFPGGLQSVTLRVKAFTEELRITSPSEDRFRWLAGAFYQKRNTNFFIDVLADDGTGNPVPGAFAFRSLDNNTSDSYAGFGSASYDIVPDQLELTLGARYDVDERESVDKLTPGTDVRKTFKSFQPKVQLAYQPTPEFNLYAVYSEGFSSGSFNSYFSGPTNRQFKSQTAENYEVGAKGSFLDGVMNVSASAFRVNYNNQQFFYYIANPPSQNITNIDRTRVTGMELEATLRPTNNLELVGALGVTDAKIRKFALDPSVVGNRSPQNTGYTLNLSAQYRVPLQDDLDLRGYASYRRQGSLYWDVANTLRTDPREFINLRLFLDGPNWSFGAFAENLTNTQFPLTSGVDGLGPDLNLRIPSLRGSYGVEANFRF